MRKHKGYLKVSSVWWEIKLKKKKGINNYGGLCLTY